MAFMKQDEKEMQRLLELYMDGRTTVEEQTRLETYFREGDVPPRWLPYQKMFSLTQHPLPAPAQEDLDAFASLNGIKVMPPHSRAISMMVRALAAAVVLAFVFFVGYAVRGSFDRRGDVALRICYVPVLQTTQLPSREVPAAAEQGKAVAAQACHAHHTKMPPARPTVSPLPSDVAEMPAERPRAAGRILVDDDAPAPNVNAVFASCQQAQEAFEKKMNEQCNINMQYE
jgi:hypothetical protein